MKIRRRPEQKARPFSELVAEGHAVWRYAPKSSSITVKGPVWWRHVLFRSMANDIHRMDSFSDGEFHLTGDKYKGPSRMIKRRAHVMYVHHVNFPNKPKTVVKMLDGHLP